MQINMCLFRWTQLGHIQGSLTRGRHSSFYSFHQHIFGVPYVPRIMLGIGIQWVRQISPAQRARGLVGKMGNMLQYRSLVSYGRGQWTSCGHISLDSLESIVEKLCQKRRWTLWTQQAQKEQRAVNSSFPWRMGGGEAGNYAKMGERHVTWIGTPTFTCS